MTFTDDGIEESDEREEGDETGGNVEDQHDGGGRALAPML
jgi:hypothetical protein